MVRRFRFLLGLLAIVTALAAATRAAAPAAEWTDDLSPIAPADWNAARAAHLLERAGFGGTPEDVARAGGDDAAARGGLAGGLRARGHRAAPFDESGVWDPAWIRFPPAVPRRCASAASGARRWA
jgi:hypothetical protein